MWILLEMSLLCDVAAGCYQPAGPLIPMSPGWDSQKIGQPAVQPVALASPGSAVQAVTSQTVVTSSSATSASRVHGNRSCEEYSQVPAVSRSSAESVPARTHKMASPGSVEVGVGTHSSDRKSSRSRSFHSSIRASEKLRMPGANVPVGAAHLVVADQERELDLSQKGNAYSTTGSGATVVTTHESIIKPAIGVVHEVSHSTAATCSSGMSQIGHLERFVHGLMTIGNGLPVTQGPLIMSHASNSAKMACCTHDSSASPPKQKPEPAEESIEETRSISPKKFKYSVEDEECSSEVQESSKDKVESSSGSTEDSAAVVDSLPSSDDTSAVTAAKRDCEIDKDTTGAVSLPDAVFMLPREDHHVAVEEVSQPTDVVETIDSSEPVSDDVSSCTAVSDDINNLPSPSKETPDTEEVGNPKNKDISVSSPKKSMAAGTVELKQRMSPVRNKNVTELSKKRTQTLVPGQEKRSEKAGTTPGEKSGRRSADEGSARSTSARRKRDTGGWEWYGDPERKQVYFKVLHRG